MAQRAMETLTIQLPSAAVRRQRRVAEIARRPRDVAACLEYRRRHPAAPFSPVWRPIRTLFE